MRSTQDEQQCGQEIVAFLKTRFPRERAFLVEVFRIDRLQGILQEMYIAHCEMLTVEMQPFFGSIIVYWDEGKREGKDDIEGRWQFCTFERLPYPSMSSFPYHQHLQAVEAKIDALSYPSEQNTSNNGDAKDGEKAFDLL